MPKKGPDPNSPSNDLVNREALPDKPMPAQKHAAPPAGRKPPSASKEIRSSPPVAPMGSKARTGALSRGAAKSPVAPFSNDTVESAAKRGAIRESAYQNGGKVKPQKMANGGAALGTKLGQMGAQLLARGGGTPKPSGKGQGPARSPAVGSVPAGATVPAARPRPNGKGQAPARAPAVSARPAPAPMGAGPRRGLPNMVGNPGLSAATNPGLRNAATQAGMQRAAASLVSPAAPAVGAMAAGGGPTPAARLAGYADGGKVCHHKPNGKPY